jgi:NAD(P)-dependent dehydrogenase (short-subunit alcohol dehydrogenase family)
LGRVALVTGVSRRIGIGFAVVRRLLEDGASVLATGWTPHDEEMPWGPGDKQGAELLDRCWAINARASMLLARSLARARAAGPGGRVILFTSAQHQGPMWKEIAWLVGEEGRWITGQVINHDGGFRLV